MTGEESISIVRRHDCAWKTYKELDPTGRWPSRRDWVTQLDRRAVVSRLTLSVPINRVICWGSGSLIAVSRWLDAVRPTTAEDVAAMKAAAPKWLSDIKPANIIVTESGPVLIDFCVNRV